MVDIKVVKDEGQAEPSIGVERLRRELAAMLQQKDQFLAAFHKADGAAQAIQQMILLLEAPPVAAPPPAQETAGAPTNAG